MMFPSGIHSHFVRINVLNVARSDYAISHGLTPFISMQNHYSLVYREEEREMFPTLKVRSSYHSLSRSRQLTSCSVAALWRRCHPLVSPRSRIPDATIRICRSQHHSSHLGQVRPTPFFLSDIAHIKSHLQHSLIIRYLPASAYARTEGNKTVNKHVEELAEKKGVKMAQIAMAWMLQNDRMCRSLAGWLCHLSFVA